jgi:hypothetical protein
MNTKQNQQTNQNTNQNTQQKKKTSNSITQGRKKNNIVININEFDPSNLLFDNLIYQEKDDHGKKIPFWTSSIFYENPKDKSICSCLINLPRFYCFGINSYLDQNDGVTHSITLCLGPKDGPEEGTKLIIDKLNGIEKMYHKMLEANREELGLFNEQKLEQKKSNFMANGQIYKWKEDKNGFIGSPTLKVKIWETNFKNKVKLPEPAIFTTFYDGNTMENGQYKEIKISDLITNGTDKPNPFFVRATIRIMGAFIGNVLSCKIVVQEAVIFRVSHKPTRLLSKPTPEDMEWVSKNMNSESEKSAEEQFGNMNQNEPSADDIM